MNILIVAAIAQNGVIGRGNALPWRLKSDMQHFRALTMGFGSLAEAIRKQAVKF